DQVAAVDGEALHAFALAEPFDERLEQAPVGLELVARQVRASKLARSRGSGCLGGGLHLYVGGRRAPHSTSIFASGRLRVTGRRSRTCPAPRAGSRRRDVYGGLAGRDSGRLLRALQETARGADNTRGAGCRPTGAPQP